MISRSAVVRLPSVKSREERCFSEIRSRRWASMFTSEAIEVSMISRLHSSTTSPKGGRRRMSARVDLLHRAGLAAVDEDAVDQVQELVARRPRRGPAVRQMLAGGQDLLGDHVEVAVGSSERAGAALLQAPEVLGGRVEPVRMIHPEPGHDAFAHQPEDEGVGVSSKTAGTSMRMAASSLMSKNRR